MKAFEYTITDPMGIHARPAGMLAKTAKAFPATEITISKGDSSAKATQMIRLMSLGIQAGDQITVSVQGGDEDAALNAVSQLLRQYF